MLELEQRTQPTYSRLTFKNKSFVDKLATRKGVSTAIVIDAIIQEYRENASKRRKTKTRSKKA